MRLLSFVGRVQLIQPVLFSVQVFWSRHFILPKSVIKHINQLCAGFLWHGKEHKATSARVSLENVCLPKAEGGLGVKDLLSWNRACFMHSIKYIMMKDGSIWIAWLYAYNLRGRYFWEISPFTSCSWIWKSILKLRGDAASFVTWNDGWKWRSGKFIVSEV